MGAPNSILTINAGSSSIKVVLFDVPTAPQRIFQVAIRNIGQPTASLAVTYPDKPAEPPTTVNAEDHIGAFKILAEWLGKQTASQSPAAIGHRLVHGGPKYYQPQIIDDELLANLRQLTVFDPEHLPVEIMLIEEAKRLFPGVKQVACFDTAFHHDLPDVARRLPIPRHYEAAGLRRYGFHGLSYAFVLQEIKRLDGPDRANGRIIIAHLGSGVSLVAVSEGKSIDTTMGLTPASGVPMSSRSGDIDPGLQLFLARHEGLNPDQLNSLFNFQSGLLGISETTSDMQQLLENEGTDSRAKEAVDLFCYQIKKSIGSLAAALGGLDQLVFTGGMGEDAPKVRERVCQDLGFLGVELDESRNVAGADLISADNSRVAVRVIHTDEAATIARDVQRLIDRSGSENQQ